MTEITACCSSHPTHQRGWSTWKCPLCQSPLRRDLLAPDARVLTCNKLHSDDQLACTNRECHFSGFGNYIARLIATTGFNRLCTVCEGQAQVDGGVCRACSGRGYGSTRTKTPKAPTQA